MNHPHHLEQAMTKTNQDEYIGEREEWKILASDPGGSPSPFKYHKGDNPSVKPWDKFSYCSGHTASAR